MVEFELTSAQQELRQRLHQFALEHMRPYSLEADRSRKLPQDFVQAAMEQNVRLELLPDSAPEQGEQPNLTGVLAAEELAWGDAALAASLPGPGLGAPPVRLLGTPEQKERLFAVFEDESPHWAAYALTEPDAGSDVSGIRTKAKKDGGDYILNGTKTFITNGARAAWIVVFATVDASLGRAGQRVFVVERHRPGLRVGRLIHKMGLRASETAELVFENCRVPAANLLGGEEAYDDSQAKSGFKAAMQTFDSTRPVVAAMAVGVARAALEYTCEQLADQLGDAERGPRRGWIVARLGELARKVDAARSLVWRAAAAADAGKPDGKLASMSKAYAGQAATEVCLDALDLLGVHGASHHPLLQKWARDIKVFDIFEGTGQIQRLIIARHIYQRYGLRI